MHKGFEKEKHIFKNDFNWYNISAEELENTSKGNEREECLFTQMNGKRTLKMEIVQSGGAFFLS